MAIAASVERTLSVSMANIDDAAVVCDAIDANTLKTSLAAAAAITTTTTNATTTKLHTMIKDLHASMVTGGMLA